MGWGRDKYYYKKRDTIYVEQSKYKVSYSSAINYCVEGKVVVKKPFI